MTENRSKTPTETEQGKSMMLIDVNVPENMDSCLSKCPASSTPSWPRVTWRWVIGEETNSVAAIKEPSKILRDGSAPCGKAKSGNLSNSVDDRRGFVMRSVCIWGWVSRKRTKFASQSILSSASCN